MKFLTFLNFGCVDICKNMLISAEKVGINIDSFYIACLDEETYEEMKEYKNSFLYMNLDIKEYQTWSFKDKTGFRNIVKYKWNLIKKIHDEHPDLCWVDTDIVFVKNPLEYISNNTEILFQCDSPDPYNYQNWICTGFMVFNSMPWSYDFINECSLNDNEDDQIMANKVAHKYSENINLLPVDFFPNGKVYYEYEFKEQAYIVHNNWMEGIDTKIKKFKDENLWYL